MLTVGSKRIHPSLSYCVSVADSNRSAFGFFFTLVNFFSLWIVSFSFFDNFFIYLKYIYELLKIFIYCNGLRSFPIFKNLYIVFVDGHCQQSSFFQKQFHFTIIFCLWLYSIDRLNFSLEGPNLCEGLFESPLKRNHSLNRFYFLIKIIFIQLILKSPFG